MLFIYSPIIVKVNIVHLVFLSIREQEISASSAELFRGDPNLYLSIKLLIHCSALTDLLLRVFFCLTSRRSYPTVTNFRLSWFRNARNFQMLSYESMKKEH